MTNNPSQKIINIARNTSYYTLALILQKVISFSYFVLVARALGPEDLGKYYFAISFTTIFAIAIDLGLSNILTREIAKEQQNAQSLISTVLGLKIPLAFVSLAAVIIIVNLLGYPELTRDLVYLSSISMVLDSFTLSFFAVLRGFHNLSYESVTAVIFQVIVFLAGFVTLRLGLDIRWLMGALAIASVFNFIYSAAIVAFKWKIKLLPKYDKTLVSAAMKIALPFAIYGIAQRFYTYLDTVLLSTLAGDREVGIYQVAFKIIFALQFLPAAFSASLYPAFASYWSKNREQLSVTFERAINYLIIISLPISIGIISIADKVVLLFKSGYGDAVLPLKINIIALIFIFLNFAVGALLNACDRQKINTVNMIFATIFSVGLNLLLIPRFQAVGASITVVASNLLMFILGMLVVPKIIKYNHAKALKFFAKVAFAAATMGLIAAYLKAYLNVFVVVPLAGLAYFVLLFLTGGFKKEDVASIFNSFIKKKSIEQDPLE